VRFAFLDPLTAVVALAPFRCRHGLQRFVASNACVAHADVDMCLA
jgi:hypothetical protein